MLQSTPKTGFPTPSADKCGPPGGMLKQDPVPGDDESVFDPSIQYQAAEHEEFMRISKEQEEIEAEFTRLHSIEELAKETQKQVANRDGGAWFGA